MDFREVKEFFKDFGKYIIVAVGVILLFLYVISFMEVRGPSMNPTFNEGELVFVSKIHYKVFDIKRNDIIVFENNGVKNLIKRVIGKKKKKIEYKDNTLYINDKAFVEEYLAEGTITNNFKTSDVGEEIIPSDCYLVLGDNRTNSQDSRELGCISKDNIIGKVTFRFWPINKFKLF